MDGRNTVDGQDVAGGLAGELVGAMAGADGNGQRVNTGLFYKIFGLYRIGQHLVVAQFSLRTNAIFFACVTGFQAAQTAQLAFNRHTNRVRHLAHQACDIDVVSVAGRRQAVAHQ